MGKSAAARAAGLTKPPVSEQVDHALRQIYIRVSQKFDIDLEFVIRGYLDSIDVARACGEAQNMLAGYRELAKITGIAEPDKARISNQVNILQITQEQLQSMPYDDLAKLMPAELRKQILDGDHPRPKALAHES